MIRLLAMAQQAPTAKDMIALARRARDNELENSPIKPLPLSEVKRRHRRLAPLVLLLLGGYAASVLGFICLVRPLVVTRSDWYLLVFVPMPFVLFAPVAYAIHRLSRKLGLHCPYCGTTFVYSEMKAPGVDPADFAEERRRCGRCHAVAIDLSA
jgi:hypothetical protein